MQIKAVHAKTRRAYGWLRILRELDARGPRVGKLRVQAPIQQRGIRTKGKRRLPVTNDSNYKLPITSNLLNREFAGPNRPGTDRATSPYIVTGEACGCGDRPGQVLNWALREDMSRENVRDALRMAWFKRHSATGSGMIFHSDRCNQYKRHDLRTVAEFGIRASMSRRGKAPAGKLCLARSTSNACTANDSRHAAKPRTR